MSNFGWMFVSEVQVVPCCAKSSSMIWGARFNMINFYGHLNPKLSLWWQNKNYRQYRPPHYTYKLTIIGVASGILDFSG